MASDTNGSEATQLQIDLKILTNTSNSTIRYPGLPASTTVGELKIKIQHELAPTPALDRMRLIYRGRILPNERDTLLDIFGCDNIKASREQNIHLVVPDVARPPNEHVTANPSTSTAGSQPQPTDVRFPPQTNHFRTQTPSRPHSQPQTQQAAGQPVAAHIHVHRQIPPGIPLPPDFANLIGQQLAAIQNGGLPHPPQPQHGGVVGMTPSPYPGATPSPDPSGGLRWGSSNEFQRVIAQQNQQRAAAATHSPGAESTSETSGNTTGQSSEQPRSTPPPPPGSSLPHTNGPGHSHVHREGVNPNGAHWSFHVDHRTINQPPAGFFPPGHPFAQINPGLFGAPGLPPGRVVRTTSPLQGPSRTQSGLLGGQTLNVRGDATYENILRETGRLRSLRDEVRQDNNSRPSSEEDVETLRRRLDAFADYHQRVEDILALGTQPDPALRTANLPPSSFSGASPRPSSLPGAEAPPRQQTPSMDSIRAILSGRSSAASSTTSIPPEVFLLSSPSGPYALLLSAAGTYASLPFSSPITNSSATAQPQPTEQNAPQSQNVRVDDPPAQGQQQQQQQQQPRVQHPHNQNANPRVPPQNFGIALDQVRDQPPQRARGPGQAAAPAPGVALMGHVWLAVRITFFLYMFSGGGGWRRPIMIAGLGLIFYLFQLGIFNAQIDMLRRHFEGLLPLPEERRQEQLRQRANEQGQDGSAQQRPSPEATAQRILRERDQQQVSWIRDQFRLVERAVALFVASLWPGLGERMIATRETRLREQREEDERREREALAAQEAEQNAREQQTADNEETEAPASERSKDKGKGRAEEPEVVDAASTSIDTAGTPSGEASTRTAYQSPMDE